MRIGFRFFVFVSVLGGVLGDLPASEAGFPGWEGMRVILQEGSPRVLRAGDLTGDGRDEVVVVNTRQSRLDIYRWRLPEDRPAPAEPVPQRPNALPTAPEFELVELPMEELPRDAVLLERGGGGRDLLVLAGPPNRLVRYRYSDSAEGEWEELAEWDLFPGSASGANPLLVYPGPAGSVPEVLIAFDEGIQRVSLEAGSRVRWFQPRERLGRRNWWLADLGGGGGTEVVEWVREQEKALRWYQANADGLLPARVLGERSFEAVELLSRDGEPDQLLLLGGFQDGILRRYRVERDAANPVGNQRMLTLAGRTAWTGFEIDGEAVLVTNNPDQPLLELFSLAEDGWHAEGSFPAVRGISGLAAPAAAPGTLLIRAEEAQDLYRSEWNGERLTFPVPMPPAGDANDRRILGLARGARGVWWAQRVGADIDVYHWPPEAEQPERTRFPGIAEEVDEVLRLGKRRILLMENYARTPHLAVLEDDGTVEVTGLSWLGRARLEEFRTFEISGEIRLGRLTEGVWQWLGEDLRTVDQVMLPEGLRMAAYQPLAGGEAWALEADGEFLHRMRPGETSIPRAEERFPVPGGTGLVDEPILGLLLYSDERIVALSPGRPWRLGLLESIDSRSGRPTGVREATIHRVFTTDLTGDGSAEVIFSDDRRHQLTALALTEAGLEPLLSWQVFEDRAYPYGSQAERQVASEPRAIVGLNVRGRGSRDLAMLSHDRLIVYLGNEEKEDDDE